MNDRIDKISWAVQTAARIHEGQLDKGGKPYILHSLVVFQLAQIGPPVTNPYEWDALLCGAVLHDVLEDCDPTEHDPLAREIDRICGNRASAVIYSLTRQRGEDYDGYIDRQMKDWICRRIKIADLTHNMDVGRLPDDVGESDYIRWDKYRRALIRLKTAG